MLRYAPNGMWTYLVSVWFLANRDCDGSLDDDEFVSFLDLITAFIWAYAIERPGVNSLRSPVYPEMENIVNHRPVTFSEYRFDRADIEGRFRSFQFTNQRAITRSMLAWWAYQDPMQELWDQDTVLEVEHIYARKRAEVEPLVNQADLEALGNKALLERRVNIRAADYRFSDKRKYYEGFRDASGRERRGTDNAELLEMAESMDDFGEGDIEDRTDRIILAFMGYLGQNGLLAD